MYWPAGFALVTHYMVQEGDSEPMLTTIGCSSTGLPGGASDIANTFVTSWEDNLAGLFSVDSALDHVEVAAGPSSAPIRADSTNGPVAGTASSGIVLPNTSVLVRKQTGLGGRKGRGRMYWPCFGQVQNMTGNGLLVGGFMGTIQGAFDDWAAQIVDSTGPGAVGELYLFHAEEEAPTQIEAMIVQQRLATQRRRLRP